MNGRTKLLLVTILLAAAVVAASLAGTGTLNFSQSQPRNPKFNPYNVVLITLDTTRKDHMSCYGYDQETTPNIDQFAKDSLRYHKCVAVSNWTLPTHASMFSGLYPESHGAHWVTQDEDHINGSNSPRDERGNRFVSNVSPAGLMTTKCVTIAEILQSVEYRTGAIIANFAYVNKAFRLDQGFEHYDDRRGQPPLHYRRAGVITDEAIGWLKKDLSRPFFLTLNYMDPHKIYSPPAPYDERFFTGPNPFPGYKTKRQRAAFFHRTRKDMYQNRRPIRSEEYRFLSALYDGEIAYMDNEIGRLFSWLRDHDLYENTLIIVTADHGEELGEHQLMGHAFSMYEPEIAVPMLVKLPRSERREDLEYGVQHVDILPTVMEVLGLPTPAGIQGVSMLQPGTRDLTSVEYIFVDHVRQWNNRFNYIVRCIYRGDLKYIEYSQDLPPEVYNIKEDPLELKNLAESMPQKTAELKAALAEWRSGIKPFERMQIAPVDQEHLDRLRDLGYAQ